MGAMITKINILPILSAHLESFRSSVDGRILKRDLAGFYGIPLIISGALLYFNFVVSEKYLNTALKGLDSGWPLNISRHKTNFKRSCWLFLTTAIKRDRK